MSIGAAEDTNFGCLKGNVQFFRDNRVVGLFEQGAYQAPHAEFAELRAWILAKLLWDPDQDVEPLYRDFFQGYYGPAAKPIRQYFDELQALVEPDENVLQIWYPPTSPYYTDAFFDRATKLWEEAEDGFAIKLFNTHYEWCLQWRVNPTVFEPDVKYKLRVRVRVVKTGREVSAFWAGVYDSARKKGWGQIQPNTSAVQEAYQWYDVATWTPEADQYLWVGPGPFTKDGGQSAIEAVYVDRFELTRVE